MEKKFSKTVNLKKGKLFIDLIAGQYGDFVSLTTGKKNKETGKFDNVRITLQPDDLTDVIQCLEQLMVATNQ